MNEFVLSGLVKRRAQLAGDIETHTSSTQDTGEKPARKTKIR